MCVCVCVRVCLIHKRTDTHSNTHTYLFCVSHSSCFLAHTYCHAPIQVIHWWSGYGRTAAMRAMRELGVHALEARGEDCAVANSQDVWQLGDGYSGVRRRRQLQTAARRLR